MERLRVRLFGQFEVQCGGEMVTAALAPKLQEMFCYLLLFRDQVHSREALASLLWPDSTTPHSRRNLRQALWQLQSSEELGGALRDCDVLHVHPKRIQLNRAANLWLDVQTFEDALSRTEGLPGASLDRLQAEALGAAVALYRGHLLQGCYHEWSLYERERLQNAYLRTLDKLMDHCETRGEYHSGLAYGERALHCDGARERTHRRLMRMHCLAGERAAALRQYDRCVEALRRELDVKPAARTVELYQRIRVGHFARISATRPAPCRWPEMVEQLRELQADLAELQNQVQDALDAAKQMAGDRE
ncbi:MAG: BTAD domain-containing putative transcriptional regulator [Anaerolineae bacterium]|jgi:DNA-binding SARP family transcriptional activator